MEEHWAGLSTRTQLAIPGIGPVVAAGPIVAALAGIGVGGALGGFAGVLIGVGIPEYDAKRYERRILKAGILVAVHCETSEEIRRTKGIMEATGAEGVSSSGEASADKRKVLPEAWITPLHRCRDFGAFHIGRPWNTFYFRKLCRLQYRQGCISRSFQL